MSLATLTTGLKELKLLKVFGETTTLESSWKTIQNHGGDQMKTKTWETPTTASIFFQHGKKQEIGMSGNVRDLPEVVLALMILLPSSI